MEYALPKDIHKSLNISLKTVYNYLKKYGDQIRAKKEHGKLFVHIEDFTNLVQKLKQPYSYKPGFIVQNESKGNFAHNENQDSKFQNMYNEAKQENTLLSKRNDTLERQLKQYGELFLSEKTEKKERIDKYDSLQVSANGTLRKYYLALAISIFLLLVLGVMILLQSDNFIGNFS